MEHFTCYNLRRAPLHDVIQQLVWIHIIYTDNVNFIICNSISIDIRYYITIRIFCKQIGQN